MTPDPPAHHRDDPHPGAHDVPPPPPAAPRELTPTARRRAWGEKHVRIWWLIGATLLAVGAAYTVAGVTDWTRQRRLIEHGLRVPAEVKAWEPGGRGVKGQAIPAGSGVDLEYTVDGRPVRSYGFLEQRKGTAFIGEIIPVAVDPANPARWTSRTAPPALWLGLTVGLVLAAAGLATFAVAAVRRGGVLRTYRDGEPVLAEVVGVGHSAVAPRSRLIRCAVHVGDDARVVRAVVPARAAPRTGDLVWLLAPPGRPDAGIPAALFE